MEPAGVGAIITAIVGPALTFIAKWLWDARIWNRIPERGRIALTGKWQGEGHQDLGPEGKPISYPLTMELRCGWKLVTGTGHVHFPLKKDPYDSTFVLQGGFFYENFLKLDFRNNSDAGKIQFGAVMLVLDSEGKTLKGKLTGYGPRSKDVVTAAVSLTKD